MATEQGASVSGDIKPGDLVMVVRGLPCCGWSKDVRMGKPFKVGRLVPLYDLHCLHCNSTVADGTIAAIGENPRDGGFLSMLIKIDPPAEGDSLPTRTDLEVPA